MNAYEPTSWKVKLLIAFATIAATAVLLESVVSGLLYPAPEAVAARWQVIAAQAEQAERARALQEGKVKAAEMQSTPAVVAQR